MTDETLEKAGPPVEDSETRRDFLDYVTAGAGVVATGAAVWPPIASKISSADVLSAGKVGVDLSGMESGRRITVKWQGKPVFLWPGRQRRSPRPGRPLSGTSSIRWITQGRTRTTGRTCRRWTRTAPPTKQAKG